MAEERGLVVDLAGFEREMGVQRSRSRAGAAGRGAVPSSLEQSALIPADTAHSEFLGEQTYEVKDAIVVASDDSSIILSGTPFYAESGGQVGDTGRLITENGEAYRIVDTVKQGETIVHLHKPDDTHPLSPGTPVTACIDVDRRRAIMRNHTATHLLHAALRKVLGAHVHQTGSLVAPDRLRFDFSHFSAVTREELDQIERQVNERIWDDLQVDWFETDLDRAKQMGAMALFDEKYSERVRVVKIGEMSLELCGGTHLRATGKIGSFRLVRESGVASGVRRIEAVTGEVAYQSMKRDAQTLQELAAILKAEPDDVIPRVETLNERIRELEHEIKRISSASVSNWMDEMLAKSTQIDGVTVAVATVDSPDVGALRTMADAVRSKLPGAAVGVLFSVINERPMCIAVVTDDALSDRHLAAGPLAQAIASIIGGGGGGKPHMAQAGGKDASKIVEAVQRVPELVQTQLQQGEE